MDERILKWLFDVKMSIDEINEFFNNEERDFLKYRNNLMLKRAVERNLEIIGEAINRILLKTILISRKYQTQKQLLV